MEVFGVTFSATSIWLLAGAGTAIAWFVVHRLTISRDRRNRLAAASANYRAAVHAAISHVPASPRGWGREIVDALPQTVSALELAFNTFAPYLSATKRQSMQVEWQKLKTHCQHQVPGAMSPGRILYDHPTSHVEGMRPKEAIERFHGHIAALLSYARET